MFCNFCGKNIAPEKRVCPYCGQTQNPRRGGNGFWDIFTPQPEPTVPGEETVPFQAVPKQTEFAAENDRRRRRGRINRIIRIFALALLILIVLEVVAFSKLHSQKKMIESLERRIETLETEMLEAVEPQNVYTPQDYSDVKHDPLASKETVPEEKKESTPPVNPTVTKEQNTETSSTEPNLETDESTELSSDLSPTQPAREED